MTIAIKPLAVLIGAALAAGPLAASVTLRPDEAASKDVFVYAFEIPDTLGVPGVPADLNFDETNIPPTALAPFGQTLGVAETTPFINPDDPDFPTTVREHTTRSLVEFDLSGLGIAADRVAAAMFQITGIGNLAPFAAPSAEFPIMVDIRPVLEMWDETTVTWNTRPGVGSIVASAMMTGGFQTIGFDLTDEVKGWLSDPATNFGFELSQRAVVQTDRPSPFTGNDLFAVGLFGSSANADVNARPALVVSQVPLPAPLALLLGAGAMLAFVGRRRAA
jgi:hypothetical protein